MMNSMSVSRVPRMSSSMFCNTRRCFYKINQDAVFTNQHDGFINLDAVFINQDAGFINQEVRQLLIKAIYEGD